MNNFGISIMAFVTAMLSGCVFILGCGANIDLFFKKLKREHLGKDVLDIARRLVVFLFIVSLSVGIFFILWRQVLNNKSPQVHICINGASNQVLYNVQSVTYYKDKECYIIEAESEEYVLYNCAIICYNIVPEISSQMP